MTAPQGWIVVETGGGCTAFQRDLYEEHRRVGQRVGELLITAKDDPSAPTSPDEPVTLGIYDTNGDILVSFDCVTLAEAVLIASRINPEVL